ncbi:hypothetical protein TheveDRAFT_1591 [Thermanaerovibrio velox DSM 12556]|uniref:MOSC domain-containing protein n=1 Tax=Thermanaerovibrio velox DSM 12556 TaxID=926567 RepID=H0UQ71_9BACT|nr:MOSC domain-containing protein [Thermanaerovibrio velox]EHM10709.1 hypothetical protein TheveDRAFT_1591 [Thermanaerovibrio velox DSM 12556]
MPPIEGKVTAVCISEKKGTVKERVREALLKTDFGLEGDAHGGSWHRQVSLLAQEDIDMMAQKLPTVGNGSFGENIGVCGIDLPSLPVGTKLEVGEALLEVTQIGKECHTRCQIYHATGDCIMPRRGIFCRVLRSGLVREGDPVRVLEA